MKTKISIRQYILALSILAVLIPSSLVGYLSFRSGQLSIDQVVRKDLKSHSEVLSDSLSTFLSKSKKTNSLIVSLVSNGQIRLANSDAFAKLLMLHLRADPNIMSVEFADKNNESVGVVRDIFGNNFAVGISGKKTGFNYNLYSVDENTNLKSVVWTSPDYDSRLRPWYIQALEVGKPAWTPIYLWPNNEYGIDYISTVTIDGKVEGVVDVSIKLTEIQPFVEHAKAYPNSQVAILEKDGTIVAGTEVEAPFVGGDGIGKRMTASESGNIVLREAAKFLKSKYGGLNNIKDGEVNVALLNGQRYFLTTLNFVDVLGIDWMILVARMENDFMGDIQAGTRTQLFVIGGLLAISVVLSWILGRYISWPLGKLVRSANSMAENSEGVDTNFDTKRDDEIGMLTRAFVNMRDKIRAQVSFVKQKEVLEQTKKNELQSIVSSIGDAVFAIDKEGKILLFNNVAEEMTGVKVEEALGRSYKDIVNFVSEKTNKPTNDFIAEAVKNDKITEMANHTMLVRRDGSMVPVADSAAPVKNPMGNTVGCVVVFRDVTNERSVDTAKTELVSLASHQMRTPLTAINWYSELLLDGKYGEMSNDQKGFVVAIHDSCARMTTLVDSLLNVSRIEMGTFLIEPVEVDAIGLAESCIKDFESDVKKKMLEVNREFDSGIDKFVADPKLLGIVFQNLLSNAVKYTPMGGKINFEIKKESGQLKISVQDNGVGIPKNDQKKMFEKLFRAENAKKVDPTGNGLGLYIVKEIVDHAGGKIWFESEESRGTTFHVTFPLTGMVKKEGMKRII